MAQDRRRGKGGANQPQGGGGGESSESGAEGGGGRGRNRGGDRSPKRDRDAEGFESVIQIKRCSSTVKGGRRFSFNAVVIVGDKRGNVGLGYGKAKEVPPSVEKAVKLGNRSMIRVPMVGGTITHPVVGRFGASRVLLMPAAPGTGIKAGRGVRDVMVAAGVTDILTKNLGSTNPINVIKATLDGLRKLRTREAVSAMRGVKV
jgi:small subunit ribosomal protein S5